MQLMKGLERGEEASVQNLEKKGGEKKEAAPFLLANISETGGKKGNFGGGK